MPHLIPFWVFGAKNGQTETNLGREHSGAVGEEWAVVRQGGAGGFLPPR
jgi:hypothetical protein